jgi:Tfp pilus assembly protein PilO
MRLPKNYFENLSAAKYREYLKLLPLAEQEGIKNFITLLLTFAALTFFGIFAINPTLSTIVDLKRQLKDNQYVASQLQKKIVALSALQQEYNTLTVQFPIIYDAIPQNPSVFLLAGQVQALAKKSGISIKSLRVFEVQLAGKSGPSTNGLSVKSPSFGFTLEASGPYEKMLSFTSSLSHINRVITTEAISIKKDIKTNELVLEVRGKGYFKP